MKLSQYLANNGPLALATPAVVIALCGCVESTSRAFYLMITKHHECAQWTNISIKFIVQFFIKRNRLVCYTLVSGCEVFF